MIAWIGRAGEASQAPTSDGCNHGLFRMTDVRRCTRLSQTVGFRQRPVFGHSEPGYPRAGLGIRPGVERERILRLWPQNDHVGHRSPQKSDVDGTLPAPLRCKQRLSETSSHFVALNPGRPRMGHEYTNEVFPLRRSEPRPSTNAGTNTRMRCSHFVAVNPGRPRIGTNTRMRCSPRFSSCRTSYSLPSFTHAAMMGGFVYSCRIRGRLDHQTTPQEPRVHRL